MLAVSLIANDESVFGNVVLLDEANFSDLYVYEVQLSSSSK